MLPEYGSKNWAEYYEYTNKVELNCDYKLSIAPTEKDKVLYAVIPCTKTIQDSWRLRQNSDARLRNSPTWVDFKEFLASLLEHPVNRGLSAADRYESPRQRADQTTDEFATYLGRLEEELPPYDDQHRKQHLLSKLRPELKRALKAYPTQPDTHHELVSLALRLEQNVLDCKPADIRAKREAQTSSNRPWFGQSGGYRGRGCGHP